LALVSPDGVAPSRMVCVSASVNLPLHHKVQKFSSGTGSPGWSRKKGCKTIVCVCVCVCVCLVMASKQSNNEIVYSCLELATGQFLASHVVLMQCDVICDARAQ